MKKRFLTLLFTAGATAAVLSACGASEPATQTESKTETATEATTETTQVTGVSEIGQKIAINTEYDNWDMIVNSVDYTDSVGNMIPSETGKKFVVLNVTLKNTGKETQYFDNMPDFDMSKKLIYDNEYEFTAFYTVATDSNGNVNTDSTAISVDALSKKNGKIIFEVPAEVADTDKPLVFKGQNLGTKEDVFSVKLR